MTFVGTADSGFSVKMDTAASAGGNDNALRPMELILIGLCGCTAMDVISILRKKRQEISRFEVKAHAGRAERYPKVFTEIEVEYVVSGVGIDPLAVERAIQLSTEAYCPVWSMLSQTAKLSYTYRVEAAPELRAGDDGEFEGPVVVGRPHESPLEAQGSPVD
jgi:putative redox protein